MFQTKVVEKIKTHILFSVTFFFRKSCPLGDDVEKYGKARQAADDNVTQPHALFMLHTKATDTHSEYVILIAFTRQQWLHERASVLRDGTNNLMFF